ncbi:MAG: hypothetical protein GX336_06515 [Halanaerobiaceae bacterium]|nr:hypothetical protein [Halanaerobiaceae bacterium]
MIKGISLYLAEKERYGRGAKGFRMLKNIMQFIIPIFMLILLEKINLSISLDLILFYLYINTYMQANVLALRAVSRKQAGIYENLLCTGLSFKDIVLIESISQLRREVFQLILSNCSIITGYYLINLDLGLQSFIIFILLANLLLILLHFIISNMAVIIGIVRNNRIPLLMLAGWISGLVFFLARNLLVKIFFPLAIIIFMLIFTLFIMYGKRDFEAV